MKQWEKRILAFEYIFSCLIKEEFDLNKIPFNIKNDINVYPIIEYSIKEIKNIVNLIIKNLSNNWKWDRISNIDKAILITSYSEYHIFDLDKKIIIDQAIITSKNYSEENSYKFINYILDRILDAKI